MPRNRPAHPGTAAFISLILAIAVIIVMCGCSAGFTVSAAAMADVTTTHYMMGEGVSEGNPLFSNASMEQMVIAKMAATGLIIWICHWLDGQGHHGWSNALQWTATAAWGGAAIWNIHQTNQ